MEILAVKPDHEINNNVIQPFFAGASQGSVYMKETGTVHFNILNAIGQVVQDLCIEKKVTGRFIYNLNKINFPVHGIYVIRLDTESGSAVKRVIFY